MATGQTQADADFLRVYAINAANQNGIPANYFLNFLTQESGFDPNAVGSKGEQGIAQIIPAYHPDVTNPFNPFESIDYAAQTLAGYNAKYGNWGTAFAAWNAGTGAVNKYGGIPPYPTTQSYVSNVMGAGVPSSSSLANPQPLNAAVNSSSISPSMGALSQSAKTFGMIAGGGLLLLAFLGMRGKGV